MNRMCVCSMHCPDSPYHETACCGKKNCECWCHEKDSNEADYGGAFDGTNVYSDADPGL